MSILMTQSRAETINLGGFNNYQLDNLHCNCTINMCIYLIAVQYILIVQYSVGLKKKKSWEGREIKI